MIPLEVDREQLRKDGKKAAAYLVLFSIVVGFFAATLEIIGVFDVVPPIVDKVIAVVLLIFYVFTWKDELKMVGAKLGRLPSQIQQRYTVDENAGTSEKGDTTGS